MHNLTDIVCSGIPIMCPVMDAAFCCFLLLANADRIEWSPSKYDYNDKVLNFVAFHTTCLAVLNNPDVNVSSGTMHALTLAALPCVDMSRCRRSSSHSRASNACVLI